MFCTIFCNGPWQEKSLSQRTCPCVWHPKATWDPNALIGIVECRGPSSPGSLQSITYNLFVFFGLNDRRWLCNNWDPPAWPDAREPCPTRARCSCTTRSIFSSVSHGNSSRSFSTKPEAACTEPAALAKQRRAGLGRLIRKSSNNRSADMLSKWSVSNVRWGKTYISPPESGTSEPQEQSIGPISLFSATRIEISKLPRS